MRDDRDRYPRGFEELAADPIPPSVINERVPDDVSELRPGAKQRSLHAVLVESLTNTKALLTRLEAGVQCAALERGVVRELYVQTRRQVKALTEALALQGLE